MTTKKDLIIAILCTFCLTATLFTILPSARCVYDGMRRMVMRQSEKIEWLLRIAVFGSALAIGALGAWSIWQSLMTMQCSCFSFSSSQFYSF